MPNSIKVSRKRIYPGTTQILLSINVNTQLQSLSFNLSTPLPPDSIFSSYVSTRTRYQCQKWQELLIDQFLNQDTIHGHKHAFINAKSIGMILTLFIKTRNDYSLAVICTESLYQLALFLHVRLELGLSNVITRVLRCFL